MTIKTLWSWKWVLLLLLLPACSEGTSSSTSAESSSLVESGVTTAPSGYAAFTTVSGLEKGAELRLRLNREGTRVDEYAVSFDSVYDAGERLLLLSTADDLIIGAGDSGSPVLDAQGRVVAALCYGWADNKHFFAARAIEDLLAVSQRTTARQAAPRTEGRFQPLGLAGPAIELRTTLKATLQQGNALTFRETSAFFPASQRSRTPNALVQPTLQPGNTVAVLDLSGDLTALGAYGTLSYQSGSAWVAFGHSYALSGTQLAKPVLPAEMVSMIDASPSAQKLAQLGAGSFGALTADFFSGIVVDPSASARTIEAVAQVTLDNQTERFTHQVSLDVDPAYQRLLLTYALAAPVDYQLSGVVRSGTGSGTVTWTFDNASTDNASLSLASSDLASEVFTDLEAALLGQTDNRSQYWALSRVELNLSLSPE